MSKFTKIAAATIAALGLAATGSAHAAAYGYSTLDISSFIITSNPMTSATQAVSSQSGSTYQDGAGNDIYPSISKSSPGGDVSQSFSGGATTAGQNNFGQWLGNSPAFGRGDALMSDNLTRGQTVAEALASGSPSYATGQSVNSQTIQFTGGGATGAVNQALSLSFTADALMKVWLSSDASLGSFANAAVEFSITLSEFQTDSAHPNGRWVQIDTSANDLSGLNQTISVLAPGNQEYMPGGTPFHQNYTWTSNTIDQGDLYKLAVTMKSSSDAYFVPEPTTALLAGLGLLGAVGSSRRRKV